jgi:hypothetical protein
MQNGRRLFAHHLPETTIEEAEVRPAYAAVFNDFPLRKSRASSAGMVHLIRAGNFIP